ncbi:BTAD domain-containing putative transcriptional regulator [Actinosynnema sp. NPDC051121]
MWWLNRHVFTRAEVTRLGSVAATRKALAESPLYRLFPAGMQEREGVVVEVDRRVVVGVLGEMAVWLDGRPQPVGHARQRSVLAVLAVEVDRVVPVDSLIDRVWGERTPGTVRSVLRVYLTHLRRALAPTGITITRKGGGYALAAEADIVDLHRFHRLLALAREQADSRRALAVVEDALALWRGEPLAELDTAWAQSVRERFRRDRSAAEADRIDWVLACGRHRQVLPELATRAEAEPLDERVAGQLMLALYRAGRQADALAHYQRTRQRLVEELGTDPGKALHELHQRILTADPTLTPAQTATITAPAGSSVVPRQLPAPPRWFTGRADHLAALDAALDRRGTVVISAIGGVGGIGKTWLALAWAHRHLDRFPDGQLFVDLRGFSPDATPTDPAVVLRGFLDALGVLPDSIPFDLGARASLYRSLVAERRMLILLDNAATTQQVTPLLPGGSTCTVLVTSRHRLPGLTVRHGARPLSLGILTEAESRALFVAALGPDRVAADESAATELIALCGGLPLALALIAARAQTGLPLHEAVTELRESGLAALDADDPTASLPAALSWSLRQLTDQQRTTFALLGIAPGPDIGLPAATSLTGLPERDTRAVLRVLADAFLIELRRNGRYAMHDLVRAYATALAHDLPDPVREAALKRLTDFYTHTAFAADRLLEPHRDAVRLESPALGSGRLPLSGTAAAMNWFDTEYHNLLAVQRLAVTQARHQDVWNAAWILSTFQFRRSHRHDHLAGWQAALHATTHLSDPVAGIVAHRMVSVAYSHAGHHDEAMTHLGRALALAEHHQDPAQQAHIHYVLARVWERQGRHRLAVEHATQALDLYRELGAPVREADALSQLAWYTARFGDHDAARAHCRAALDLHRLHGYPNGEATTLDTLGWIDHHTGNHQQAIERYRQALDLFRALDNTIEYVNTLENLGHPHVALGQYDHAHAVWREAQDLYRKQGREADVERVQQRLDGLHTT